jgi:hypothetical protein
MDKIYIAVISGALLWYIKTCYTEAMRMKLAAARIRAYTIHWKRLALDSEFYPIYASGEKWSKKERELMTKGKTEELVALREDVKKIQKEKIQESVKAEKIFDKENRHNFIEKIQRNEALISGDSKSFFIEETNKNIERILDEKIFINEEDSSCLGAYCASTTLHLKMEMIKLITNASHVIIGLNNEEVTNEHLEEMLIELAFTSVNVSRAIETLSYCAEKIYDESSVDLTIRRMFLKW